MLPIFMQVTIVSPRPKIILAPALPVHIRRAAVQPAAEGVGVAQLDRDHLEAELVELFGLPDLAGLDADGPGVEDQGRRVGSPNPPSRRLRGMVGWDGCADRALSE